MVLIMSELSFRTHCFASVASGTYLFFPVPSSDLDRKAELRAQGASAHPQRVVVFNNPDAPADAPTFSGVASGNTLYVVLAPEVFDKVLADVRKPERDSLKSPVTFNFELDAEEGLVKLAIDGQALVPKSYVGELSPTG